MSEQEKTSSKQTKAGKAASYTFALIVTLFLAWESVSAERRGESTPLVVWFPSLVLIGTALGVNIDAASIGRIFIGHE